MRVKHLAGMMLILMLSGCTGVELAATAIKKYKRGDADPHYKIGRPYEVRGVWYYPERNMRYDETGIASWYGKAEAGRPTANGEIYDPDLISAAHKTLPLPSVVRVTNLENGRSLAVRVNDRGPFITGRIIDLSEEGARLLGFRKNGVARVRVQILAQESLRLENEAKQGNFPLLGALPPAKTPKTQAAPAPSSNLTLHSEEDTSQSAPAPATSSALALINTSRSSDLQTGTPLPTQIWIQVGAFRAANNAKAVKKRIANIANTQISTIHHDAEILHRVRLGPLASVEEADRVLRAVIQRGYQGSKIILD